MILAVRDFGHDDPRISDSKAIFELANCYAESGAASLITRIEEVEEFETPMAYRITDLFMDEVRTKIADADVKYY